MYLPSGDQRALEASVLMVVSCWASPPVRAMYQSCIEPDRFDSNRRTHSSSRHSLSFHFLRLGVELVLLKRRFREAGLELAEGELPDYLPVLLEFAELEPEAGVAVLAGLRGSLELVRSALHERGSPYAHLLEAVVEGLPALTRRQRAEIERLAVDGPPTELVGLDSFTPPELEPFLAGGKR